MAKQHKLYGINDDTDECAKCGKTGLKRVMWIAETVDGEAIADPDPYGTTCGARLLGIRARNPQKIQAAAYDQLYAEIADRTREIMGTFVRVGQMLFPADIAKEVMRGNLTTKAAVEARIARHPILEFINSERDRPTIERFARFL
jgi:hypothetical protein